MTPKIRNFRQKLARFGSFTGAFLTFLGSQKNRFRDFFKVVLKFFKMCLDIIFAPNRHTFGFFSPTLNSLLPIPPALL